MTRNYLGAMVTENTYFGVYQDVLFGLPSGSYLTRFEAHGIMPIRAVSQNFVTGTAFSHVQVCGLQYGPSGYGGTAMNGNTAGANYVTWGDAVPGTDRQQYMAGTSPIAEVVVDARQINLSWRGLFKVTAATDFAFCSGYNPGFAVSFSVNYAWFAEWAT